MTDNLLHTVAAAVMESLKLDSFELHLPAADSHIDCLTSPHFVAADTFDFDSLHTAVVGQLRACLSDSW